VSSKTGQVQDGALLLSGERRERSVLVVVQGGSLKLVDLRDSSRCGSRRTRSYGSLDPLAHGGFRAGRLVVGGLRSREVFGQELDNRWDGDELSVAGEHTVTRPSLPERLRELGCEARAAGRT